MRVILETTPTGPLSVLEALPSQRLAILEGLNGIGKTLAVKLLQICTGSMPYRTDSAAWESLCTGLGQFEVTVSDLNGDVSEIHWNADTASWRTGPGLGIAAVGFNSILLDNRPGTLEDVRKALAVIRIAGDEGLVDALAQSADSDGELVRAWAERRAGQEAGPLQALEREAEVARDLIPSWTVDRYDELIALIEQLSQRRRELEVAIDRADQRRKQLLEALDLKRRLDELHGRAPELEARLREVGTLFERVQAEREALDKEIALLAGKVAMAKPAKRELRNATRTLERNRANLIGAAGRAARLASSLGLPSDRHEDAEAFVATQREWLEQLSMAQAELDASPVMQGILGEVAISLGTAEQRGLGEQLAFEEEEGDLSLTVSETRAGFVLRRARLESQPPPPEAREISDLISSARTVLNQGIALLDAYADIDRFRRLVETNEERVTDALVVADPKAESEMRSRDLARRELDKRLLEIASERAALQEQLGTPTGKSAQQSLEAQLGDLIQASGETSESLPEATEVADRTLTDLQVDLSRISNELASASAEQSRGEGDSRHAAAALSDARYSWFADAHSTPATDASPGRTRDRIASYDRARRLLDLVLERLGAHRAQLAAVSTAMHGIAKHIRGEDSAPGDYGAPLEQWLGDRFSEWFNLERVREQLLPDATGEIRVDVAERTAVWSEGTVTRSRPLDAFSSGEQAFAYTRARIGVLDEDMHRPSNRLIVLDEFGAFIAHDRMKQLTSYLRDRVSEHPNDQVLVILPLSRDYGELAETAVGKESERLAELHEQVASRKYAIRALS